MGYKDKFIIDTLLECLGSVSTQNDEGKRTSIMADYYEKLKAKRHKEQAAVVKQIMINTCPAFCRGYFKNSKIGT